MFSNLSSLIDPANPKQTRSSRTRSIGFFSLQSYNHSIIMDGAQLSQLSSTQKDELMRTVQAQVALANMQELISVRDKHLA
jgi:hypothetical protein